MTTSQPKRSCNSLTEALTSVSYRPAQRHGQPSNWKPPTSVSPPRSAPHLQRPAGWDGHAPRGLLQQLYGRLHGLRLRPSWAPTQGTQSRIRWDETPRQRAVLSATHAGPCSLCWLSTACRLQLPTWDCADALYWPFVMAGLASPLACAMVATLRGPLRALRSGLFRWDERAEMADALVNETSRSGLSTIATRLSRISVPAFPVKQV